MRWARPLLVAVTWVAAFASPWVAAEPLPRDSGAVNVRDFGAKGDGRADDTQAIRDAIMSVQIKYARSFWPSKIVYFPAGTYRVTDTLFKKNADGKYLASMSLLGESRDSVRLKLDDGAEGFGDASQPKAVVFTASTLLSGSPNDGGKDYLGQGEGNDAYGNYVEDMTIDVGRDNPGAIAIDYLASNVGAIRRLKLVAGEGSGHTGIAMTRKWPGPLLVTDVEVDGYARGIAVRYPEYHVTLDRITLKGQREAAIRNEGNSLSMHDIRITTGATAVQNLGAAGLIVADKLSVTLTDSDAAWADNRGYMTFRNVSVEGGGKAVKGKAGRRQAGAMPTADGAYFKQDKSAEFEAGWTLEGLPTPPAWNPPLNRWANIASFGAAPNTGKDASPAIEAAMATGAEVIYFPSGTYTISRSIKVPKHVRRFEGMLSALSVSQRDRALSAETGMFSIATDGEPLTIDRIALIQGNQVGIEHKGSRTVVLSDVITMGAGTRRLEGGGPLFTENTCCGYVLVKGEAGMWSRQFNTEGPNVRITNVGAPLWILGIKSEQNSTVIRSSGSARTDVLGGLLYRVKPSDKPLPAFVVDGDSKFSAAYAESAHIPGSAYGKHVVRTIGGHDEEDEAEADDLPQRGLARMVPGFVAGKPLSKRLAPRDGAPGDERKP